MSHESGSTPAWLQVNEFYGSSLEYYTDSHTIGTPAESANTGLLAVGATPYYDTSKIEPYSSQGPTTDGRVKPDVVGVDCGSSVTYPVYTRAWDNNQQCWFPGTSQASPHMAGLAALVRQANPSFTPQQTANYLKTNAVDRGASGADNVWGSGFAQLSTAPAANCDRSLDGDGTFNGLLGFRAVPPRSPGAAMPRYYSFTLSEQKTVTMTLDSDDADTYLIVRGASDSRSALPVNTAWYNDDFDGSRSRSRIAPTLPAGNYVIEAATYDSTNTGDFILTIASSGGGGGGTPPPTDSCSDSITADGTTSGTWAAGCQSAETGRGYARYYSFTTTEAKDVTVVLDSTVDTYMYLRSGTKTGAITAQNDDHGSLVGTTTACANSTGLDNTDSCITITGLAAGSYTIEATTYATATAGNFTLTVSGLGSTGGGGTPPPADTCTDSITADGTTNGTWAAGCQSAETGRGYARYYGFTTTEAKDVTITLDSTVDTYMYLRSGTKTGAITAQNDDHGSLVGTTTACANSTGLDNTDSCITITGLAAGSYTIEATTYATATTGQLYADRIRLEHGWRWHSPAYGHLHRHH